MIWACGLPTFNGSATLLQLLQILQRNVCLTLPILPLQLPAPATACSCYCLLLLLPVTACACNCLRLLRFLLAPATLL